MANLCRAGKKKLEGACRVCASCAAGGRSATQKTCTAPPGKATQLHGRGAQGQRWLSASGVGGGGVWAAAKRAADSLEEWIKSQAVKGSKQIFLFNLKKKLATVGEARGMAELFLERIRETSDRLEAVAMAENKTDERSVYHIQTSCLVLAAFRVLTEQLHLSKADAITSIRQCLGDSDSLGEKAVAEAVKLSSRVMVTAMRGDESSFLVKTAYNMSQLDFGESFHVQHTDDASQHIATVKRW